MPPARPHVVVIGGGTGCPTVLRALLEYPVSLSAIVTVFDNGGSTGRLRAELDLPAVGDLRRALGALASPAEPYTSLARLMEYRFPPHPDPLPSLRSRTGPAEVRGHVLGNLLLASLSMEAGGLGPAVARASSILQARGAVIPVSLERAHLGARLSDGTRVLGEELIDSLPRGSAPVAEVFLEPPVPANPQALEAIGSSHLVVLGPGDLYTSVLPNLLVLGIAQALGASSAPKVLVCNLTNRPGQTEGFTVSAYAREVVRHLGGKPLDAVLVSNSPLPADRMPVPLDREACAGLVQRVRIGDLASEDGHHHDGQRLGTALWQLWQQELASS